MVKMNHLYVEFVQNTIFPAVVDIIKRVRLSILDHSGALDSVIESGWRGPMPTGQAYRPGPMRME